MEIEDSLAFSLIITGNVVGNGRGRAKLWRFFYQRDETGGLYLKKTEPTLLTEEERTISSFSLVPNSFKLFYF